MWPPQNDAGSPYAHDTCIHNLIPPPPTVKDTVGLAVGVVTPVEVQANNEEEDMRCSKCQSQAKRNLVLECQVRQTIIIVTLG